MSKARKKYDNDNLPPLVADSGGYALPKPGPTVAVCVAPADAVIRRPASWGEGQALAIKAGSHHIAQDGAGDSYPNAEYATFYEEGHSPLDPARDPRAAFLAGFWAGQGQGHSVVIREARKTRPADVLGIVAPEAHGCIFRNHEGETELSEGGLILQSPDDASIRWFITRKVFDKKYQGIEKPENS